MKKIELIEGIQSSIIGFGCAPIQGSIDSKTARYALDYALDAGINHLDLARSYGFGDAEKFIGKCIKGKRNKLVLASKFGIKANWKSSLFKTLKPAVRLLRNKNRKGQHISTPESNKSSKLADMLLTRIEPLRPVDMKISLEKSLKELNSDYLDYFFVHEPYTVLSHINELKAMAEKLKAEGKIRAWGLAYMQSQKHLHESYLSEFDIEQFNTPAFVSNYEQLVNMRGAQSNIIFSPMRGGPSDLRGSDKLRRVMKDFPNSVVLCSMFNLNHIKENVQITREIK